MRTQAPRGAVTYLKPHAQDLNPERLAPVLMVTFFRSFHVEKGFSHTNCLGSKGVRQRARLPGPRDKGSAQHCPALAEARKLQPPLPKGLFRAPSYTCFSQPERSIWLSVVRLESYSGNGLDSLLSLHPAHLLHH